MHKVQVTIRNTSYRPQVGRSRRKIPQASDWAAEWSSVPVVKQVVIILGDSKADNADINRGSNVVILAMMDCLKV